MKLAIVCWDFRDRASGAGVLIDTDSKDDCIFHDTPELPDIAGKRVVEQMLHRLRADLFICFVSGVEFLKIKADKARDVAGPFPEGGDL